MKKYFIGLLFLFFGFALAIPAYSQQHNPPFWNEIQAYKQQDKLNPPSADAILFVGSSSIRLWKNLDQSFPERTVMNRGFGGSTLVDLQRYLSDIVLPYQPKQVVIYSGENDIATGKVGAQEVLERFSQVFEGIRKELPHTHITFISMKPSPSRSRYLAITAEANRLIEKFLQEKARTSYVDVYTPMLDKQGKPREALFVKDMLHMNEQGYQLWTQALEPFLIE